MPTFENIPLPDQEGRLDKHGGSYVPEQLQAVLDEITQSYNAIKNDPESMSLLIKS